jgi:hypothetical protein
MIAFVKCLECGSITSTDDVVKLFALLANKSTEYTCRNHHSLDRCQLMLCHGNISIVCDGCENRFFCLSKGK